MPSVRTYFLCSIKNLAVILGLIATAVSGLLALALLDEFHLFGKIFYILFRFHEHTRTGIIFLILIFFGYKAYLKKREKSFKKEFFKMTPAIIFWLTLFSVSAFILESYFSANGRNFDCDKYDYTEKLNAGVKEFQNQKYSIKICGSGTSHGGILSDDEPDLAELTIKNEQGELLVKRHYVIEWDAKPGHEPLIIGSDSITYQDDDEQKDYTIAMPPSLFERLKAKYLF